MNIKWLLKNVMRMKIPSYFKKLFISAINGYGNFLFKQAVYLIIE